jgi:hypothetical protein
MLGTRFIVLAATLPLVLASAVWYGFLVYLGSVAGANWALESVLHIRPGVEQEGYVLVPRVEAVGLL